MPLDSPSVSPSMMPFIAKRHHHRRHAEHRHTHAADEPTTAPMPKVAANPSASRLSCPATGHHHDRRSVQHPRHRQIDPADQHDEICPAATNPTNDATTSTDSMLPARKTWPHQIADDEQQHGGGGGIQHPPLIAADAHAHHCRTRASRPIPFAARTATTRNSPS